MARQFKATRGTRVEVTMPSMAVARKLEAATGKVTTYLSPPDFVPLDSWPPRDGKERLRVGAAVLRALPSRHERSNWRWFMGLLWQAKLDTLRLRATGVEKTPEGIYRYKESA